MSILNCRRSLVSIFAILCLTAISIYNSIDTSMSIATIVTALAASNAYNKGNGKKEEK